MAVRVQVPPPAPKAFRKAKGPAADVLQKQREPFFCLTAQSASDEISRKWLRHVHRRVAARRTVVRLGVGAMVSVVA